MTTNGVFRWKNLSAPFFVLAPMEDVTDSVFRQIILQAGKPDVFFTEFVSVEGMQSRGRKHVIHRLQYTPAECPLIAQIWGITPEAFYKTALELAPMGFAGIDINMGCPQKEVVKRGACAGLIRSPNLAKEIIHAVKEGSSGLPVSVKTRIGIATIETEEWIGFLLQQELDALTVHVRTVAEMSKVPAHWEELEKVVTLRNTLAPNTVLIANGDIVSRTQGINLAKQYGIEGLMVGRGIFSNPWIFADKEETIHGKDEKIELLKEHFDLFSQTWPNVKNFHLLKKFLKMYTKGFRGGTTLRNQLLLTQSLEEAMTIINEAVESLTKNKKRENK